MKRIALIFDDGPSAEQRIELSAVLEDFVRLVSGRMIGKVRFLLTPSTT